MPSWLYEKRWVDGPTYSRGRHYPPFCVRQTPSHQPNPIYPPPTFLGGEGLGGYGLGLMATSGIFF